MDYQFQCEDPFGLVISGPCGPWGEWSQCNIKKGGASRDTVMQAREDGRPVLKSICRAVLHRLARCRHVFLEAPLGSIAILQPEMQPIKALIDAGKLHFVRADGCALGYADAVSGLPHYKPMGFITSMAVGVE